MLVCLGQYLQTRKCRTKNERFFYAKIKEKVFSVVIKNNIAINKSGNSQNLLGMEQVTLPNVEKTTLDDVATSVLSRYLDAYKELIK